MPSSALASALTHAAHPPARAQALVPPPSAVHPAEAAPAPLVLASHDFRGTGVRVAVIDGEPWFVVVDVCHLLGIANPRDAAKRLRAGDLRTLTRKGLIDTVGLTDGIPEGFLPRNRFNLVNEPGLYALILRSDKPEAVQFQDWIAREVLPSIRATGGYAGADPTGAMGYINAHTGADAGAAEAGQAGEGADSPLFTQLAELMTHKGLRATVHLEPLSGAAGAAGTKVVLLTARGVPVSMVSGDVVTCEHGPMELRPAGIRSWDGKPYDAYYRCPLPGKKATGFCGTIPATSLARAKAA
jgi:prophage antirepressor-like protein